MKKFTLAAALLGGLTLAGAGSVSAADWYGGGYRIEPVRHTAPVHHDIYPVVTHHDDVCYSTPVRRSEPIWDTHFNDRFDKYGWNDSRFGYSDSHYRYNDYRYSAPVSHSKGFGLSSPNLSFWYGR